MFALFLTGVLFSSSVAATRADLAVAYLRFEQAFEKAKIQDVEQLKTTNREFDSLTFAFFAGRYNDAIRSINQLTGKISKNQNFEQLAKYKVTLSPRVVVAKSERNITVTIDPLYGNKDEAMELSITDQKNQPVMNQKIEWNENERGAVIIDNKKLLEGVYKVQLVLNGEKLDTANFFVLEEPILKIKEGFLSQINALPESVKMQWKDALKSRIGLLTEEPSEINSAQFLANPVELIKAITEELQVLQEGKNPYKGFTGDYWMSLALDRPVPMRVFCANTTNKPKPVIIALHGAGGDENMFMDAYGNGIIKKFAKEQDAILVSPRTELFVSQTQSVLMLLDFLKTCHNIDDTKIFVLGHSMGAGGVATLLDRNENIFSACAMIAGGRAITKKHENTRILFIAGELDPLFNVNNLRRQADNTKNAGNDTTFKTYPEYGHTLVVSVSMSKVFDFFFSTNLLSFNPCPNGLY